MKPAISIVLDTRRALNKGPHKGLYPIKLKATFQVMAKGQKKWVPKYFPLDIYCSEKDYERAKGNSRNSELKAISNKMIEAQAKANAIVDKYSILNAEKFARLFNHADSSFQVKAVFEDYIYQLEQEEREGSATAYRNAKSSLLKYGSDALQFDEINADWLKKYQSHMLKKERSRTTIGMYLRCLRRIFNVAIKDHLISSDSYPFAEGGFKIPITRSRKIALDVDQKNLLLQFTSTDDKVMKAKAFWTFSYYCNGINFADVLRMKRGQVGPDYITLYRTKSINTAKVIKPVVIPLREEVRQIIAQYGAHSLDPETFLFPVLNSKMNAKQMKGAIQQFIKETNKGLVVIQDQLKLPFSLTTYTTRHTFATVALRNGASKAFLQEALGLSSISIVDTYADGLDYETKKAISDRL